MLNAAFISPVKAVENPVLFRDFQAAGVQKATLEITGLGLYRAAINGSRVGTDYLSPGCNDYDAYLRYQTYDVTDLVKAGDNRIEVKLGDGWYKGRFGLGERSVNIWGDKYVLCARLTLVGADGAETVIETDASWLARASNIAFTGIYDGEIRDDNRAAGEPGACEIVKIEYKLTPDFSPTIRAKLELKPTLYVSPKGEQILDFGQNMVGVVRFACNLPKGETVTLRFGEVLQQDCFYRDNLRSAKAEYTYISDGAAKEVEAEFTFFGFRYALVEGMDKVRPEDFVGVVLYSDLRETMTCETDSPKVNQLMKNALWGQRGNFVDVPTDCPQRDERLGWTADTQVFVNTACYQMDCKDFYRKFMRDMRADQTMYFNGDIPMYSPSLKAKAGPGGAVWADAGAIIPMNVYQFYGDKDLLEENWPMMKDYADMLFARDESHGGSRIIDYGFTFGDWLALDGVNEQAVRGGTDDGYIKTVYYWNSVRLAAEAATILGHTADAARYEKLAGEIREAILNEYFSASGRLCIDTQTGYVLALYFRIWRDRDKLLEGFQTRLKKDGFKLKSGFTGTPLMMITMIDNGMVDDAYRLLLNEEYPGWLYCVNLGATTIWERWNSLLPDGSISGTGMNSLNHYAYGSVCEAIYSRMAGLKCGEPGWKTAVVKPHLSWRMRHISVRYDSPVGAYAVAWRIGDDGQVTLNVEVPDGATAKVILPDHPQGETHDVGPGKYAYTYQPTVDYLHPFTADTRIFDLLGNEKASAALEKAAPELYTMLVKGDWSSAYDKLSDMFSFSPFTKPGMLPVLDECLRGVKL